MNHPRITSVKALEKYRVRVQFDDDINGVLDLSELSGKDAFKQWDEDDNFDKVFIDPESGAITWPGNLDIDTLTAWLQLKGMSYEQYKSTLQTPTHTVR